MNKTLIIALSGLMLGACAGEAGTRDTKDADYTAHFGKSVRQNINAQIVNPDAPSDETLEHAGARAARQQDRYLEDKVEKPRRPSTVEGVSTGGDEGGGEGGGG